MLKKEKETENNYFNILQFKKKKKKKKKLVHKLEILKCDKLKRSKPKY